MNRIIRRKIGIVLVFSFIIAQISSIHGSFVVNESKAADSGFLYFGRYVQTLIKDESDIAFLSKQSFNDNKEAVVNGVKVRKNGSSYYKEAPIKWRIISTTDDSYTLLSEFVLENRAYGYSFWDEAELRTWLNNDFLKAAFNEGEQSDIYTNEVVTQKKDYEDVYINRNDKEYNVISNDKVYLLSAEEAVSSDYGFNTDKGEPDNARIALATDLVDNKNSAQNWWLRGRTFWSYGNLKEQFVGSDGKVKDWYGTYSYGVRPVIRIKKNSSYILNEYSDDNKPFAPSSAAPSSTQMPSATPVSPSSSPSASSLPTASATPSLSFFIDSWGFYNHWSNFGNSGYYITQKDYNRLVKNLSNIDIASLSEITDHGIEYCYNIDGKGKSYVSWKGSCFGMSVTTCLVNSKTISTKDLYASETLLSSSASMNTVSAINYYMWQQRFRRFQNVIHEFSSLSQKEQISQLEKMVYENRDGTKPAILGFFWYPFDEEGNLLDTHSQGHCVVAYGVETGTWNSSSVEGLPSGKSFSKRILIYDCSAGINDKSCLYYDDSGTWCIPCWNINSIDHDNGQMNASNNGWLGFVSNQEWIINGVDYRTGKLSDVPVGSGYSSDYVLIESENDSYQIASDSGIAEINGTMVNSSTYKDQLLVTTDLCISDITGKRRSIVYVPDDKICKVTSKSEDLSFRTVKDDSCYAVISDSSGQIELGENGNLSVSTDNKSDSSLSICSDDKNGVVQGCDTVFVSVDDTKKISVDQNNSGVVVEGDNLNSVKVAGYDNAKQIATTNVKTDKDKILISGTKKKLLISEDSNGDGKYDKVIASASKKSSKPGRVKIKTTKRINEKNKIKVSLSWDKEKNASGYQIQVASMKSFKKLNLYTTKKTKIKVPGKAKGKNYIRVRAYLKSGKKKIFGKWSKVLSI